MTLRAIDVHVHHRTGERAASSKGLHDALRMFGASDGSEVDLAGFYRSRDMRAVVFDVDAETNTGERCDNDEIIELVDSSDGVLIGFATVDPWKASAALREMERCHERGLRGLKVQPVTQAFALGDRRFYPIWDFCRSVGWPVMVHTGTTGIGAGSPGGGGFRLKYGRPIPDLDDVAADFLDLNLIAAHFAWPWHLELLAVARHKSNVFVDLSGWAPKYIPEEVLKYCNSVIPDKFLFGTDFPLISPDRWLSEFEKLDIKDSVRSMVLYENAARLLDIEAS
ncbi:MAG: amidohydrolase family protein [Actinomycetota bacterium]